MHRVLGYLMHSLIVTDLRTNMLTNQQISTLQSGLLALAEELRKDHVIHRNEVKNQIEGLQGILDLYDQLDTMYSAV